MTRNFDDYRYRSARARVRARDRCCKWPGCTVTKGLVCHHIRKWSTNPTLRFMDSNMIMLCRMHHKQTFRKEEAFAPMFLRILSGGNYV